MVVSPVLVVVSAAALSPPSPSVEGRGGSGVWSLTLRMLIVATFMAPLPRSNLATTKVLRLPNAVAFVPISTSRTVPMRILVFLFAPQHLEHWASEVTCTALVSILVPMVQCGSIGAISSVFLSLFRHLSSRGFWCLYAPPQPKK